MAIPSCRTYLLLQTNTTTNGYMPIVQHLPVAPVRILPDNITVLPSADWPKEYGTPPPVSLMRDPSMPGPRHAYALESGFHPVDLDGPSSRCFVPNWGQTFKAVIYPQVGPLTFEAPHPLYAQLVDIDRLNLPVVRRYLDQNRDDDDDDAALLRQHDPYYRSDPQLMERLQDETNLYLVKTISIQDSEFGDL